ncbi:unnamed protein product [Protopolystoma xenopodis]|uniref:Uncharacterized protein n=1 Tax=Protopolystoma xenopodis TaxID=117903 RepID=A0A448WKB6_9PLAT|nr:unnamed protein product [Protopolystoma xenopodis]
MGIFKGHLRHCVKEASERVNIYSDIATSTHTAASRPIRTRYQRYMREMFVCRLPAGEEKEEKEPTESRAQRDDQATLCEFLPLKWNAQRPSRLTFQIVWDEDDRKRYFYAPLMA